LIQQLRIFEQQTDHTLEIDAICIDYLQNIINVAINSSKTDQCGKKNWQIQKILKKKTFAQHRIIFEEQQMIEYNQHVHAFYH
jgi:hypothetical protein